MITLQQSSHLKAIAILMMLGLHLFNRDYTELFQPLIFIGSQPLSYYISLFCDACVPIFAFVSGYGLYYKYTENHTTYANGNVKRLKKLYINYWIVLFIFAVFLGLLVKKEGYPGTFGKFVLNFTAIDTSYNGAWWFLTTYILFVLTSSFWFKLLEKLNPYIFFVVLLIVYIIAFYFRIYKTDVFNHPVANWLYTQSALYFCTLFQFMVGAFALKYEWNNRISRALNNRLTISDLLGGVIFIALIVFHALIPNFIIAPFTAIIFIFTFLQMNISTTINRLLDFFAVHSTNMWLIHMFFCVIFFRNFVYSFKYVPIIFIVLVSMCVLSSYVINFLTAKINKLV